ncbi:MAG: hypothetical protein O2894_10605 [Planctomycetota bacterium]|nr:hypothetical protein [Planctomycetota bacterium]
MRKRVSLLLLLSLGACGAPGRDLVVKVPPAPLLPASQPVAEEIGRLLSPDPEESKAAEQRLVALDGERLERLLTYAKTLEGERDLRLMHVLDEHHALPDLPPDVRLDFLLWKASRPERFYAMKARSRLMDLAKSDPQPLVDRVAAGAPGTEILAVVLGVAGVQAAIGPLVARYRAPQTAAERTAAAEALALLTDGAVRPRASGALEDLGRDADAVLAWQREQLEREASGAAVAVPAGSHR